MRKLQHCNSPGRGARMRPVLMAAMSVPARPSGESGHQSQPRPPRQLCLVVQPQPPPRQRDPPPPHRPPRRHPGVVHPEGQLQRRDLAGPADRATLQTPLTEKGRLSPNSPPPSDRVNQPTPSSSHRRRQSSIGGNGQLCWRLSCSGELCGVRVIPAADVAVAQVKTARRCQELGMAGNNGAGGPALDGRAPRPRRLAR